MERRQAVRFLGAALALPFLPRSAAAAIELGEQLHLRIGDAKAAALGVQQQSGTTAARFVDLPAARKTELLTALDAERASKTGAALAFARLKHLTVLGYFTSKPVQVNVLNTRMFFDGYHGDVPFTPAV